MCSVGGGWAMMGFPQPWITGRIYRLIRGICSPLHHNSSSQSTLGQFYCHAGQIVANVLHCRGEITLVSWIVHWITGFEVTIANVGHFGCD